MLKRKEFILGAAVGLTFAAAATAGGVIQWPGAEAAPASASRLIPSAGAAGLAFAPPQGAPLSFADIFQQVAPAVVQIDVKTRVQRPRTMQMPGFPFPFLVPPQEGDSKVEPETQLAPGSGSGFFISADGTIVTNNHVVANAEEISVKLSDGRTFKARLIGRDEASDLAVIKIEGDSFPFVSFEEASEPRVGDWVIAVGNPFGLGGTATAGIVSAKSRDIGGGVANDFLQIDAAINRGNSGGPTFDIYGRVIGVNTAIFSPSGGSVGIGFAIPAKTAKEITDRLIKGETIERGYLGVQISDLQPEVKEALGLDANTKGAFVAQVTAGSPAAEGGLQEEDIVTSINGEAVDGASSLTRRVANAKPGDRLRLEVLREGRRQTVDIRAGRRPSEESLNQQLEGEDTPEAAPNATVGTEVEGVTVTALTAALRQRHNIPDDVNGVVVTAVDASSEAGKLGIPAGLVIFRANNRAVTTPAEFRTAVEAARTSGRPSVLLMVLYQGNNRSLVLPLAKKD
ncbi:Do family serine endopeptidase [Brevundimonas terrae]|uniref:Do family serine endopeptidase n=1 Tax=Brevundimonas terrae TaxID=363631 RepID=A0ABP3I1Y0_9CAUL|nr:Do family serine endopeptidase [Brevundimonas terrae]NIJ27765.1 serine protease Do [Brevundimonas terrae]